MSKSKQKPAPVATGTYHITRYAGGLSVVMEDSERLTRHEAQALLTRMCNDYRNGGWEVLKVGNLDLATVTNGVDMDMLRVSAVMG